jgi:hypothetical protein
MIQIVLLVLGVALVLMGWRGLTMEGVWLTNSYQLKGRTAKVVGIVRSSAAQPCSSTRWCFLHWSDKNSDALVPPSRAEMSHSTGHVHDAFVDGFRAQSSAFRNAAVYHLS